MSLLTAELKIWDYWCWRYSTAYLFFRAFYHGNC